MENDSFFMDDNKRMSSNLIIMFIVIKFYLKNYIKELE